MERILIESIYNKTNVLEICSMSGHDIWVNTHCVERDNLNSGMEARIYSWSGSQLFSDLYDQVALIFNQAKELNTSDPLTDFKIDLSQLDQVEIIDKEADKSILRVFKDQAERIGIQTDHAKYRGKVMGPIVWLCASHEENATDAMKKRSELSLPLFDLAKHVAERFNQPE